MSSLGETRPFQLTAILDAVGVALLRQGAGLVVTHPFSDVLSFRMEACADARDLPFKGW